MPTQSEHRDAIFPLVDQIGTIVGFKVSLYRWVVDKWLEVLPTNNNVQYLDPYAFSNIEHYGAYVVAASGQGGLKEGLKTSVTVFNLRAFPGSCALCISTAARVYDRYKSKGVNRLGIKLRMAIAGSSNYTALVCTDVVEGITHQPSMCTLKGAGFAELYRTKNKRTSNRIGLFIKEL